MFVPFIILFILFWFITKNILVSFEIIEAEWLNHGSEN